MLGLRRDSGRQSGRDPAAGDRARMRRAERLFRLVEVLRGRRLAVTAASLAEIMEVSLRTVYRDIAALQASGAPIEGAAGVGYVLDPRYHLPPLMFDADEVQALLAGLAMARAFTDDELGHAAMRAEEKLRAALDDEGLARADRSPYRAPLYDGEERLRALHRDIRKACEARRKLRIAYADEKGAQTERVIRPIALLRWRAVWTLIAWCELRADERHFRVDRIRAAEALPETFPAPSAALIRDLDARIAEETGRRRSGFRSV